MSKSIYFIRHGYALHNDLFWSIGTDAYKKYQDTPLLHKGYLQANDCKKKHVKPWNGKLKNIDIVVDRLDMLNTDQNNSVFSVETKDPLIVMNDIVLRMNKNI